MTISLISGGNLTGSTNNGGSVTLTFPVGVQQNDVVYVCSGIDGTATVSTSGYTPINNVTSVGQQTRVWRKVMGVTPDADVTITGTGQPQDAHTVVALILRDVEITQPEDATSTIASGSSTNPDNPAITTVTNRAWVLAFASSKVNDSAITAPSGYINQTNIAASDTNNSTTAVATKEVTNAGTEDPASWTDWATGTWGAITVAVRPGGFVSVNVTGNSSTGQVGSVTVNENEVVVVNGLSGQGQLGSVKVPFILNVTGVEASGSIGDLQVEAKASVGVTNVLGITVLGEENARAFATVSATGTSASGQVGGVDFIFGTVVRLFGVVGTGEISYADVWIGINDEQFGIWTPVDDSQTQNWRPAYV